MTASRSEPAPKRRALICEDEGITIMQLRKALRSDGYEVIVAVSNTREAVEIAMTSELDLILMDLRLSDERTGIEAAREILAHHFVPIVMLTATIAEDQIQEAFEAGVCGYLAKPITSERLLPALASILSRVSEMQTAEQAQALVKTLKQSVGIDQTHAVVETSASNVRLKPA